MREVFVEPVVLPDARFRDGLGIRYVRTEGTDDVVEVLRPLDDLAAHRVAIQHRVSRLSSFRQARFVPVRRAESAHGESGAFEVVSDFVPGHRLSEILDAASAGTATISAVAAIHVIREVLGGLAVLHESRGLTHGAVAPERLILAPKGRILVADYVLGGAIARLEYSRARLWREFRVATVPGKGAPKFDEASEVVQVGVTAAALLAGRPVEADEYTDGMPDLLASLGRARHDGRKEALPGPVIAWVKRAVQADSGSRFAGVADARLALENALSRQSVASGGAAALRALAEDYGRLVGVVDAAAAARAAAEAARRAEEERTAAMLAAVGQPADETGERAATRTVLVPAFTLLPDAPERPAGDLVAGASLVDHVSEDGQAEPAVGWRVPEPEAADVPLVVSPLLERTPSPRLPRDAEFPEEIIDLDLLIESETATSADGGEDLVPPAVAAEPGTPDLPPAAEPLAEASLNSTAEASPDAESPSIAEFEPAEEPALFAAPASEAESVREAEPMALTEPEAACALPTNKGPDAQAEHAGLEVVDVPAGAADLDLPAASTSVSEASAERLDTREPAADEALSGGVLDLDAWLASERGHCEELSEVLRAGESLANTAASAEWAIEQAAPETGSAEIPFEAVSAQGSGAPSARQTSGAAEEPLHELDLAALEAEPGIAACFLNDEDRTVVRDLMPVDTMPSVKPLPLQEIDLSVVEAEPEVAALFQPQLESPRGREAAAAEGAVPNEPLVQHEGDQVSAESEPTRWNAQIEDSTADAPLGTLQEAIEKLVIGTAPIEEAVPETLPGPAALEVAPIEEAVPETLPEPAALEVAPFEGEPVELRDVAGEPPSDVLLAVAPAPAPETGLQVEVPLAFDAEIEALLQALREPAVEPAVEPAIEPAIEPELPVEAARASAAGLEAEPSASLVERATAEEFRGEASILVVPGQDAARNAAETGPDQMPAAAQAPASVLQAATLPPLPTDWLIEVDVASRRHRRKRGPERPAQGLTIDLPEVLASFGDASQPEAAPPSLSPRKRLGITAPAATPVEEAGEEAAALLVEEPPIPDRAEPECVVAFEGLADAAPEAPSVTEDVLPAAMNEDASGPVFPRVAPSVQRVRAEARRRRMARLRATAVGTVATVVGTMRAAGAGVASGARSVGRQGVSVAALLGAAVRRAAAGSAGAAAAGLSFVTRAVTDAAEGIAGAAVASARALASAGRALAHGAAAVAAATASGFGRVVHATGVAVAGIVRACAACVRWGIGGMGRLTVTLARGASDAARRAASAAGSGARALGRAASAAGRVAHRPRATAPHQGGPQPLDLPRRAVFALSDIADLMPRPRVRLSYVAVALAVIVGVVGTPYVKERWFTPVPPSGTVRVEAARPGLVVSIDGISLGEAPLSAELPVGPHRVEVAGAGRTRVQDVEVVEGRTVIVQAGNSDLRATGSLRIDTDPPGAEVWVDGVAHGAAPVTIGAISEGAHAVVVRSGEGSVRRSVTVRPDETAEALIGIKPGWMAVFAPVRLEILEGGKPIGSTEGGRLLASPGDHTIEVVSESLGYRATHRLEVRPGEVAALTIKLPPATLDVLAPPGVEVWIDGTFVGTTPLGQIQVAVGTRDVQIRQPGAGDRRQSVSVTYARAARVVFN